MVANEWDVMFQIHKSTPSLISTFRKLDRMLKVERSIFFCPRSGNQVLRLMKQYNERSLDLCQWKHHISSGLLPQTIA